MTTNQKMLALQALADSWDAAVMIRKDGSWYVHLSHVERKEGGVISSGCGTAATPDEAIDQCWAWATDPKYYMVRNAHGDDRRAFRWNGFMWEEVRES